MTDGINDENLKKLGDLNQLNQKILDNAPVSVMVLDKQGNIVSVSEYFKKFSDNLNPLNKNIFDIPFFKKEGLVDSYRTLLETGESFEKHNCRTFNYLGEEIYISITAVALFDNGQVKGAISMATDSTGLVLANKKLEAINKELEEKVFCRMKELQKINKELDYALKLKSQFIADYSHELRAPLSIIRGNVDLSLLRAGGEDQPLVKNLNLIKEQVKFMSGLLQDLALLANMDAAGSKINLEEVDLINLLDKVAQSLAVAAEQKNITVRLEKEPVDLIISGDGNQLEILFSNILRNAIKYGRPGGKVSIRLEEFFNQADIIIEDDGLGIAEQDLPHIFSRFYRAEAAKSSGQAGSGLGLAICQRIIEAHQGRIEVKSQLGQGSIFTVHLPV